jgi:hypothetical protein
MPDISESEREFEDQQALAAECYTPEIILNLARNFGVVEPVQIDRLRDGLVLAAWVYLYRPDDAAKLKPRSIRNEIEEIRRLADELNSKLDGLSKPACELFWLAQRNLEADLFWVSGEISPYGHETSPYGHTIVRREYESGARSVTILKKGEIREAVRIICNLSNVATTLMKPDMGGRPSDYALHLWVRNAQRIWENVLGRKFTYQEIDGHPASAAFAFCREALSPLAPSVTRSALTTAIREAIKLKPKKRPHPRASKQKPPSE